MLLALNLVQIFNNCWMRLSRISRIIQTEVNVTVSVEAEGCEADNIDRGLNNSGTSNN